MDNIFEFSGTFSETIVAGTTGETNVGQPGLVIVPIRFSRVVEEALQGTNQNGLMESWLQKFRMDYAYGVSIELLSLGCFYELPSKKLAPVADIDLDDSDAVKTKKMLDLYFRYEKVGLKLWVYQSPVWRGFAQYNEPSWFQRGETILQNKGMQMKLNLLPYLGANTLDADGGVGFQIINKGNGGLGTGDYISIFGEYRAKISYIPKVTGVINLVERLNNAS